MITKQIEILSCALKHKNLYTPSYRQRIILARKRTIYLLQYRFGYMPIGWVGEESEPVILYQIKKTQIGYPSHKIGALPWLGKKQFKEYKKPYAKEVTDAVNYLEKFLTKYGNSIHKMDSIQFDQFRKIIEGGLV